MRVLERNKRQMWLSRPVHSEVVDEETGLGTGEYVDGWAELASVRINAAPPTGSASESPFGADVSYDLVLVADANEWGIAEGDVMWLSDDAPNVTGTTTPDMTGAYTVTRVSPSINFCAFGLTRRQGR